MPKDRCRDVPLLRHEYPDMTSANQLHHAYALGRQGTPRPDYLDTEAARREHQRGMALHIRREMR